MITFEQARAIVAENRSNLYPAEANYQVATWGYENETHYQLFDGPYVKLYSPKSREAQKWITPDTSFAIIVNKETGEYQEVWGLEPDDDRVTFELPNATRVGERP